MANAPVAAFAKDADGRYVYANPFLLATMNAHMGSDWLGKTDAAMWPPAAAAAIQTHDERALRGEGTQVFSYVMQAGHAPHTVLLIEFALPGANRGAAIGGLAVDITASALAQDEHCRLEAAIDQARDLIMMVDIDGRISEVNTAFERVSGYGRDEVIGQGLRFLESGLQSAGFYEEIRATLSAGGQWSGEMVDRRKDGSFFTVKTLVSPVRGAGNTVVGYVSVSTDVTDERALAAEAVNSAVERGLVLASISGRTSGASLEAKAHSICHEVASLAGIAAAEILVFETDSQALPIGHVVPGREDPPLERISFQISRRLHARAAFGAWIESWENRQGRAYNQLIEHVGPSALAYAPIYCSERLVGLLAVQSIDVTNKGAIDKLFPLIVDFAAIAGSVLGPELCPRIDALAAGEHVSDIIKRHAFTPVFQPIVDIFLDRVVGYEALTRFTDGSDPEALFAEAKVAHRGLELEIATLTAALAASTALPSYAWLNVNASPDLILQRGPLRNLISHIRRPLVVEVTEHTAIVDYPAFRRAVEDLGQATRLAVDDAGAGFASLRHILELHPAFVKLDRWLVAGLESDQARQAMIAGLHHFARKTGCQLIAEGVETDREIAVLRSLDIHLGQGYVLGRPRPVDPVPVLVERERAQPVSVGG